MAYDEHLAERIARVLKEKQVSFEAKKMMGGLCYMIKDKMAVGVVKNSLMVRLDPALYESSLEKTGCRPMDFTGQVVKGFLFVDPIGIDLQNDLEYWIQLCLNYNPKAKSSKRTAPAKKQKPALKKKKY